MSESSPSTRNGSRWRCSPRRSSSSSSTPRSSTSRCPRSVVTSHFSQDEPVVGRQRLHARLRRLPAARRAPGRPARPPAHVHRRPDPLRRRFARRRSRPEPTGWLIAARAVQGLGAALLSPAALSIVTTHLRRGRRAQPGAGRVGRGRRLRRRRRRAARRHADRVGRLGVGAVRQRADRPRRGVLRAAPAAREPQRAARATSTSPARSRSPPACRCSSTRSSTPINAGWGSTQTIALIAIVARADRALRGHRAPLAAPARRRSGIFRIRTLTRRQRGRAADGDVAVLDVLLRLALHAAGARLRRAEDRPRLPAAGVRDHRLGRRRLDARDAHRLQADADRRACS